MPGFRGLALLPAMCTNGHVPALLCFRWKRPVGAHRVAQNLRSTFHVELIAEVACSQSGYSAASCVSRGTHGTGQQIGSAPRALDRPTVDFMYSAAVTCKIADRRCFTWNSSEQIAAQFSCSAREHGSLAEHSLLLIMEFALEPKMQRRYYGVPRETMRTRDRTTSTVARAGSMEN